MLVRLGQNGRTRHIILSFYSRNRKFRFGLYWPGGMRANVRIANGLSFVGMTSA